MVLVVGPNVALDHIVFVDRLDEGPVHEISDTWSVGGGGPNVARVLRRLGFEARLLTLLGGHVGQEVLDRLRAEGANFEGVPVAGDTRVDTAVVERARRRTTLLLASGPVVTPQEWRWLDELTRAELGRFPDLLVLSGSLPPGVPEDAYARWVLAAHEAGVPVAVDASGQALRLALDASPDVVKVTWGEFARAEGLTPRVGGDDDGAGPPPDPAAALDDALLAAVDRRLAAGVETVILTRGRRGAYAFTPAGVYHAGVLPLGKVLTTVGLGDAFMAGWAAAYLEGEGVCGQLQLATAAAALAVLTAGGDIPDQADPHRIRAGVEVRALRPGAGRAELPVPGPVPAPASTPSPTPTPAPTPVAGAR